MKVYDIVGYALDGEVYCECCFKGDPESEDVNPIFAGDEGLMSCGGCGSVLDTSWTDDDVEYALDLLRRSLKDKDRDELYHRLRDFNIKGWEDRLAMGRYQRRMDREK